MTIEKRIDVTWMCLSFAELSTAQLYDILQLRSEVFVVEQDCVYQDLDGKDKQSLHVCGYYGDTLAAYARLVPPGLSYREPSIGRVLTKKEYRASGLGKQLMNESITQINRNYPPAAIRISAQLYLLKFYTSLGFISRSEPYMEDGIPHVEMVRTN